MQRQSLGSPSSKLYNGRAGGGLASEDGIVSHSASSSSTSPTAVSPVSGAGGGSSFPFSVDDEEFKLDKALQRRSSLSSLYHSRPERFIHVIPFLVLVCIFVLYLCSHEPSPKDLIEIDYIGRYMDKGEMLGIHSLRYLQEIKKDSSPRKYKSSHRKLADI